MARSLALLTALYHLFSLVLSASLLVKIPASSLLTNPSILPSSTHATLTSDSGVVVKSLIRKDNSILFPQIRTTGSHLLKIYTRDYVFSSYRIDTTLTTTNDGKETLINGAWEIYLGSPWTDTGVPLVPSTANGQTAPVESLTIHSKLLIRKQFYEERPAFSPLSLLKNPMILMGGVALIFTFGMPKLMENMDPEMKAEYEEMQKNSPMSGLTRAMQGQGPASGADGFDLAGYLAGQGSGGSKATGRDAGNIRERKK